MSLTIDLSLRKMEDAGYISIKFNEPVLVFSNFTVLLTLSNPAMFTANSTISPAKPGKSSVP